MADPDDTTKRCSCCREKKSRAAFSPRKSSRDGLRSECRLCSTAKSRTYARANPEKVNAANAVWRKRHPEQVKATSAAWVKSNLDRWKANKKAWNTANPEKVKACNLAWARANPEKVKVAKTVWAKSAKRKAYETMWRKANPEKTSAKSASWRKRNPEKHLAAVAAWQAANPIKTLAKKRAWRLRYLKRERARVTLWQKANPDRVKANGHRRRALKRAAPGSWTAADIADIRRMQRDMCACCRTLLKGKGSIDHIVALSKGGTNHRRNIQLVHVRCNSEKNDRDAMEFMRSRGFLL